MNMELLMMAVVACLGILVIFGMWFDAVTDLFVKREKMSVTLKNFEFNTSWWNESKGVYTLQNDTRVRLYLDNGTTYTMKFLAGFKCDGLSVPKIFRWFLPSWDEKNMRYNWAGAIHDALYGNKGFGIFSREECDDIFRGALRESNIGRFKAGCADKAVEWFANKHFGDDSLDCARLVTLE